MYYRVETQFMLRVACDPSSLCKKICINGQKQFNIYQELHNNILIHFIHLPIQRSTSQYNKFISIQQPVKLNLFILIFDIRGSCSGMGHKSDQKIVREFGGPIGSVFIMIWSHFLMLYLWLSLQYYQGGLFIPNLKTIPQQLQKAMPTYQSVLVYWGFMILQIILAFIMPGPIIKGLPVPSQDNKQYNYLCNALYSWYFTLILVFILHYTGIFPLTFLMDNFGSMMVTSMISGDIVALVIYLWGILSRKQIRMSGNIFFDYFMGSILNPRLGKVDLKLFAQIRASWLQLFLLTLSAALKQKQQLGYITNSMYIMILAHFLYANACMKGQECVPTTWDIFYEKFGWMLIFWNISGVPYVYCFQSVYLLKNGWIDYGWVGFLGLVVVLVGAYYVWDTAQSQKNRFRMKLKGTYVPRKSFPQLPWGTLQNPKYLQTQSGSALLTDGWWQYARKIHYTCDIIMASVWALSCRFTGFLPFYYPIFFTIMILHRYGRDQQRCKRKYGKDWDRYCEIVKYVFVPYVI